MSLSPISSQTPTLTTLSQQTQPPPSPLQSNPTLLTSGSILEEAKTKEELIKFKFSKGSQEEMNPVKAFCRSLFGNAKVSQMNHLDLFFLHFSGELQKLLATTEFKQITPDLPTLDDEEEVFVLFTGEDRTLGKRLGYIIDQIFFLFYEEKEASKDYKILFLIAKDYWQTLKNLLSPFQRSKELHILVESLNTCFTHMASVIEQPTTLSLLKELLVPKKVSDYANALTVTENFYCSQSFELYGRYVSQAKKYIDYLDYALKKFEAAILKLDDVEALPADFQQQIDQIFTLPEKMQGQMLQLVGKLSSCASEFAQEKEKLNLSIEALEKLCPNVTHANVLTWVSTSNLVDLLPDLKKKITQRVGTHKRLLMSANVAMKCLETVLGPIKTETNYVVLYQKLTLHLDNCTSALFRLEFFLNNINQLSSLFYAPLPFFNVFLENTKTFKRTLELCFKKLAKPLGQKLSTQQGLRPIDSTQQILASLFDNLTVEANLQTVLLSESLAKISWIYEELNRGQERHTLLEETVGDAIIITEKLVTNSHLYPEHADFFKDLFSLLTTLHLSVAVLCEPIDIKHPNKLSLPSFKFQLNLLRQVVNFSVKNSFEKRAELYSRLATDCAVVKNEEMDGMLQIYKSTFDAYCHTEEKIRSYFLSIVPKTNSEEAKRLTEQEWRLVFSKVGQWGSYLLSQLTGKHRIEFRKIHLILQKLAQGDPVEAKIKEHCMFIESLNNALPYSVHKYGIPFISFFEAHSIKEPKVSNLNRSKKSQVPSKKLDAEKKSEAPSTPSITQAELPHLIHHLKGILPLSLCKEEDSLFYNLRDVQIQGGLENILYYSSLLNELSQFKDELTFPRSLAYLLNHLTSLTLETAFKVNFAFVRLSTAESPSQHLLFQPMKEGAHPWRATHNLSSLFTVLNPEEKEPELIFTIAQATLSTRYPASRDDVISDELFRLEKDLSLLKTIEERSTQTLALTFNTLKALNPALSLSFLERPFAHQHPLHTHLSHEKVVAIKALADRLPVYSLDVQNLFYALACCNELLQLDNPLPIAESYTLALLTFTLIALEMAVRLHREELGDCLGEDHDLSLLPSVLKKKRGVLFSEQEEVIFKEAQNRLKVQTRYPGRSCGTLSQRLNAIHQLCMMKNALESNWVTEDLLYQIKIQYHKEPSECLSQIQQEIKDHLTQVKAEALSILDLTLKVLELLETRKER